MPHIFISYSTSNQNAANRLCAVLERNDHQCWIASRDIPPGAAWPEAIATAIRDSQLMISLVSEEACRSRQIARELENADALDLPVLPIRLDATPLQGQFKYFLGNRQWLDLFDGSPDDNEEALLQAVRAQRHGPQMASQQTQPSPIRPELATRVGRDDGHLRGTAIHAVIAELKTVVVNFVSVVARREKALENFDLTSSNTIFFAARFLVYMSVISIALHIPAWRAQGVPFGQLGFMLSALAGELIEMIALCFALYAIIRVLGSKVDLQPFFSAFCLMSAFVLMSNVCLVPVHAMSISAQARDLGAFFDRATSIADQLSVWSLAVLFISTATSVGLKILFLTALLKTFSPESQLGVIKRTMCFALGAASWIVILLVFSQPFEANLYKSFGGD
jgi:hypothetical protein